MAEKITRRQAVLGVSSTLLLPAACSQTPTSPDTIFAHGIASGDPDATSVVIWTRVSGSKDPVAVDWYVARDSEMLDVVSHRQFTTNAQRDHTVKQVVDGLEPGKSYFYQFVVNGTTSTLGRTKTLPVGHVERCDRAGRWARWLPHKCWVRSRLKKHSRWHALIHDWYIRGLP